MYAWYRAWQKIALDCARSCKIWKNEVLSTVNEIKYNLWCVFPSKLPYMVFLIAVCSISNVKQACDNLEVQKGKYFKCNHFFHCKSMGQVMCIEK